MVMVVGVHGARTDDPLFFFLLPEALISGSRARLSVQFHAYIYIYIFVLTREREDKIYNFMTELRGDETELHHGFLLQG